MASHGFKVVHDFVHCVSQIVGPPKLVCVRLVSVWANPETSNHKRSRPINPLMTEQYPESTVPCFDWPIDLNPGVVQKFKSKSEKWNP